jgi:hypothetical protein
VSAHFWFFLRAQKELAAETVDPQKNKENKIHHFTEVEDLHPNTNCFLTTSIIP